ncbi:MAG: acetate--CoA ligase family protein, partial [Deltaproteobacteria bacterium]|nr:acetate--CoA ligase family protein [Deltaproteobacteria bacterium]
MKLHEYQSKNLFASVGIPVPKGKVISSAAEISSALKEIGGSVWALKAQIHAGGRGKGGGIKVAKSEEEARKLASDLIGKRLVTPQTGPQGKLVRYLLAEEGCQIAKEFYVGFTIDRAKECVVAMVSAEGGMEIEELAAKKKGAIVQMAIDPLTGMQPYQARQLARAIGLEKKEMVAAADLLLKCCKLFVDADCSLVEINPLVLTPSGSFIALDAKVSLDDNALFRHKDLASWRDAAEED